MDSLSFFKLVLSLKEDTEESFYLALPGTLPDFT